MQNLSHTHTHTHAGGANKGHECEGSQKSAIYLNSM